MIRIIKTGFALACIATIGTSSAGTLFEYNGPAVAIPDASATGIDVTIPVSGLATISDLNILFRPPAPGTACTGSTTEMNAAINHTFTADIEIRITSPAGTTVTVLDDIAGSRDNICAFVLDDEAGTPVLTAIQSVDLEPLTGHYTPLNPLSAFDGQNPNGNWTINVRDDAGADTGSLRRIGLQFQALEVRQSVIRSTMLNPTGTMADRIFRNAIPSACDDKVFPTTAGTPGDYQYNVHTYTNPLNRPVCVPFELQVDNSSCLANLGMMGYQGGFVPTNIATNYRGDTGNSTGSTVASSVFMRLPVPANATMQVVVYTVTSGSTTYMNCPYHINVGLPAQFDDSLE